MITAFGKALRKLRIDHGEVLKNMADRLQVSVSFLSAVENGKKSVPAKWIDQITEMYHLNPEESDFLRDLASDAATSVKIDFSISTRPQRKAALIFARDFSSISDEKAQKIISLLEEDDKLKGE